MNRNYWYILLIVFAWAFMPGAKAGTGGKVQKQTFVFAVKGQDTLSLDKYEVLQEKEVQAKPVVLFAFGGGFKGGERDAERYVSFFRFLAENGYVVVSTDYRTALKNAGHKQPAGIQDFVVRLQNAIQIAVEDFYDATGYVIQNSKNWNIDPSCIIACGSSAGAITVLQAEYEICNHSQLAGHLPGSFNYAGIISFAGAICNPSPLQWENNPCPIMMFHGDADKTVPFDKAVIEGLGGIWGSATIARQLAEMKASFYFYKVENAGHSIADTPLANNQYDVLSFLSKQVLKKQKLEIITDEKVPGETVVQKIFTLQDYIQNNSGE